MTSTTKNAPARSGNSGEGNDRTPTNQEEGTINMSVPDTSTLRTGAETRIALEFHTIDGGHPVGPFHYTLEDAQAWLDETPHLRGRLELREVSVPVPPVVEWADNVRVFKPRKGAWTAEATRDFRHHGELVVFIVATFELTDDGWKVEDSPEITLPDRQDSVFISDPTEVAAIGALIGTAGLVLAAVQESAK